METDDVTLTFPPHPIWVRTARDAVRAFLQAAGHHELIDTATLLTSEAVTNAINACAAKHCTAPVTVTAGWRGAGCLSVLVRDEAPGLPECRGATPYGNENDAENGRGIHLISYEARAWGVCTHGPGAGKGTWFELSRHQQ
ncbi:ATP-binding protein [Streptomyces sp. NPDC050095]|uniref:ATP-binding protein n=1 Tax=unclassified Streptomyces TaxID=2593676 RepID=UPI00343D81B8